MPRDIPHFIGGTLISNSAGRTAPVFDPATGEQTGSIAMAATAEKAVSAARKVFPIWAGTTPLRRARVLNRFLRIMEEGRRRWLN